MSEETKDKFTPGPWTIVGTPDSKGNLWIDSAKTVVATVQDNYHNKPELVAANAKLIASAPDLLAALVLCMEEYMNDGEWSEGGTPYHIMAARAAIDKARNGA